MADDAFSYKTFHINDDRQTVNFDYVITREEQTYELSETLKFPIPLLDSPQQSAGLRALHLALGISYYKIFVSANIRHSYQMNQAEADFWNEVWLHGLGEFLYVNQLSPEKLAKFTPQDGTAFEMPETKTTGEQAILGIGGGKDSVVAGELLKNIGVHVQGFVMATGEQLGQTQAVAKTMGVPLHVVERNLDKQLLELQERQDAFKGHIPISLIFGLVGTALATALETSYVVVANEASASIPRVTWEHGAVNHQWSKSFEFEQKLQSYVHEFIAPDVTYFSAIRELTSVGVAKKFASYPQYFEVFTSDNYIFRIDPANRPNARWSLESAKSLSSFILLAPWLSEADMLRTFGRDFLSEASLEPLFLRLVGQEGTPALDCVGTVEELILSLNLAAEQGKFATSHLMKLAAERQVVKPGDWQTELTSMLKLQPEQALPVMIRQEIFDALGSKTSARTWDLDQFKDKDVVFVGAGKGRAMAGIKEFLETHGQIRSFEGVDKHDGPDPLGFLKSYNSATTVFVKNEGVPGTELSVPYVTQLQLFFSLVGQTGATTIGITGTKGKSTTTALTAHILKTAGKHAILAGNIGNSPLQDLDTADTDTIFVLELSSYQLSDLKVSPHISACLNLYNDHTDWHGSLEKYWEAKHNIMRFAGKDDIFVYNPDFPALQQWALEADCETIAINTVETLDMSNAHLFGEHNRLNALVAQEIARQFGISDEIIRQAIDTFKPLRHRMQVVATKNGKTYIDDAIGMTPESTTASLKAIHEKFGDISVLFLGGQDRNYDFSDVMREIAELNIPNLVMFPDTVEKMKAAMPESYKPEIFETTSMQDAVRFAAEHAAESSVVLLSTAAPSYVLWKDFEDKGNQFQDAVNSL